MAALAQTLHGYDRGHRLLASGGDVAEDELSLLDRLSDLSGYLPGGVSFDRYYTGFPCGRHYAFACTWLDVGARRGGTVLTHTLLIPLAHAEQMSDIFAAASLHRRPLSAEDRSPYAESLDLPPPLEAETPVPAHARDALALLFGQPDRPILWMDTSQPLAELAYLWRLSWPVLRRRFAFCTLALQERTIDGRPFDFLALPPEAQGAFHKLSGSMAWWRRGELGHPGLASLPVVETLEQEGAPWIASLLDRCRALDLPVPDRASDVSAVRKLLDVRDAARQRLTAARAWTDLLVRLWPMLPAEHTEWRGALEALMVAQEQAPLEPRPLWELTQLVARPQARELAQNDADVGRRLADLLEHETGRRLAAAPERAGAELPGLLDVLAGRPEQAAVYRAVRHSIMQAANLAAARTLAQTLLDIAAARTDTALFEQCLAPLPAAERQALLADRIADAAAGSQSQLDFLHREGVALAVKLGDPELAFALWRDRGDPAAGLAQAAQAALVRGDLASLEPVLQQVDAEICLSWSLETTEATLARHAASWGAKAANALRLEPEALAERCAGKPNGTRIFASGSRWLSMGQFGEILSDRPLLAWDLAILGLTEPDNAGTSLVRASIEALPAERLWSPSSREVLAAHERSPGARAWLESLGPRLLWYVASGNLDLDEGAAWLRLPAVHAWLDGISRFAIERYLERPEQTWLRSMTQTVFQALHGESAAPPGLLYSIVFLVQHAGRASLDIAAEDLLALLQHPACQEARRLRAEVLLAVRREEPDAGSRLAAAVFHDTYNAVLASHTALYPILSQIDRGWNRGKTLRHWLLDTWVRRAWPIDDLVRCLDSDTKLARKFFRRASKQYSAKNLLRRLGPALHDQPDLYRIWEEFST